MRILDILAESRVSSVDPRHPSDPKLVEWFGGGGQTTAGVSVTEEGSLTLAAVYAAVRVLSVVAAGLPVDVYRRQPNGDREIDREHPASRLIREEPNPEQTSIQFRGTMKARCVLWGNGYAEIERTRGGDPVALWPIHPSRVTPERDKRRGLVFHVREDSSEARGTSRTTLMPEDMLHIPNLPPGGNGVIGKSTISYARESLGLALGAERTGSSFYANGMRPSGVLQHPGNLGTDARERLRDDMQKKHGGSGKMGSVMILEEGMAWHQMTIPPEDAQFLETREFQDEEIARWFGVPQHLIGMLKRATNNNIEHQSLEFVMFTLDPWLKAEAQEMKRKLLREREKKDWFIEHNLDGLLRGDTAMRKDMYAAARQWGWFSVNEIRRKENMNGIGEAGDVYLQPGNMVDAEDPPDPNATTTNQDAGDAQPAVSVDTTDESNTARQLKLARAAIRGVVVEALTRMAKIEVGNAEKASKRTRKEFDEVVETWETSHWQRFRSAMVPAFAAARAHGIDVDTAEFYRIWAENSRFRLENAGKTGEKRALDVVIGQEIASWATDRVNEAVNKLFGAE